MKKALISLAAFLVFIPLAASAEDTYYALSYARLSYVKGDVYVQRTSDLGYEKGEVNLAVVQGDKLGTREGQVEIQLGRQNYLRIDEYSQVEFAALPSQAGDLTKIHILEGNIYLRVRSMQREKDVEVHTADASFYILNDGLYRFNLRENKETELLVYEGSAEAAGEEGSLLVKNKEKISASNGKLLSEPDYFYSGLDGFDRWNEAREELLYARRDGRRYLPASMDDYEGELHDNGRWVDEEPYGYVWVPYVSHQDWRPYYYGRWVWYPVIGWTWISSESWGWCTYHYGRWHWRMGLGWYWIPSIHWGPAWVHWWGDRDYVGWCPLSWWNRPVVIVNNHFYDRFNDRAYPWNSRALTVIHRNQLQSPALHRQALREHEVRSIGRISLQAGQPSVRPTISRTGLHSVEAGRIFSRPGARVVGKSFTPGGAAPVSRLRSAQAAVRTIPSGASASRGSFLSRPSSDKGGQGTPSSTLSRSRLAQPPKGASVSREEVPDSSRRIRTGSELRVYPSRRADSRTESRIGGLSERMTSRDRDADPSSSGPRIKSFLSRFGSSSLPKRDDSESRESGGSRLLRSYPSRVAEDRESSPSSSRYGWPNTGSIYRRGSSPAGGGNDRLDRPRGESSPRSLSRDEERSSRPSTSLRESSSRSSGVSSSGRVSSPSFSRDSSSKSSGSSRSSGSSSRSSTSSSGRVRKKG